MRRNQIHANYGRLHGETNDGIELQPFVTNQELGDDAVNASVATRSFNDTGTTLVPPPPSNETTLVPPPSVGNSSNGQSGLETPANKTASSSVSSSNESLEFKSMDNTLKDVSSAAGSSTSRSESPRPDTPHSSTEQVSGAAVSPIRPESSSSEPEPTSEGAEPTTSTPLRSLVDRIRGVGRRGNRRTVSRSDPTRVQPRRNAKKKINYKE